MMLQNTNEMARYPRVRIPTHSGQVFRIDAGRDSAVCQVYLLPPERAQRTAKEDTHELCRSKYPPAKPGALVLEPLKAAYPCRTSQASLSKP